MNIKTSRPRNSNKHRNYNKPFYQSKAWKELVKAVWIRDEGMCQQCARMGIKHFLERRTKNMEHQGTVDHKTPRPQNAPYNPNEWDSMDNLELIGSNHHAVKSSLERKNLQ